MTLIDGSLGATILWLGGIPDPGHRLAAFTSLIINCGNGTITMPPGDANTWGPHEFTFTHRGITGFGDTAEEATADWLKCARRVVEYAAEHHAETPAQAQLCAAYADPVHA